MHAGVSSDLQPNTSQTMKLALSNRQNYSMVAEEIFCQALARTVWVYRDHYAAVDIFLNKIRNTGMESVATEAGLATIADMVFKDDNGALREFLFTLKVQFFSQFSEFNDPWTSMIVDIAKSLTNDVEVEGVDPKLNLVPEDLRIRTYSAEYMAQVLLANSWLVMFLFVALWGRTLTYDELRAKYRRSNLAVANNAV
jgi:hypothetical protein